MGWKTDEEIRRLRQEVAGLREDIRVGTSSDPADRIWSRLKNYTYVGGVSVVYDLRESVIRTVGSGEVSRKEMIKFLGLEKENN